MLLAGIQKRSGSGNTLMITVLLDGLGLTPYLM